MAKYLRDKLPDDCPQKVDVQRFFAIIELGRAVSKKFNELQAA